MNAISIRIRLFLESAQWIGILWIGLGLTTWYGSVIADFYSIVIPIVIGIICFVPFKHQNAVYFVLVFATCADRIVSYYLLGVISPIFVWILLVTYITRNTR